MDEGVTKQAKMSPRDYFQSLAHLHRGDGAFSWTVHHRYQHRVDHQHLIDSVRETVFGTEFPLFWVECRIAFDE